MEAQCKRNENFLRAPISVMTVRKHKLARSRGEVKVDCWKKERIGRTVKAKTPEFLPNPSRAANLHPSILLLLWTFDLFDLSNSIGLGLDMLVRLAGLKLSLVDVLIVTLELVLAGKADLVIFAGKDWAFEVLRLEAMLGRGVAFEVAKAFSSEVAVDLTAFQASRLAVMAWMPKTPLMPNKLFQIIENLSMFVFCCPLTASQAAAKCP